MPYIQDRWFEERRQLYLDLIEFATEAYEASQELTFREVTPERRAEIAAELRTAHSNFWSREPRVLLLGSDAIHKELTRFGLRMINLRHEASAKAGERRSEVLDREVRAAYKDFVNVARSDLGIGPLKQEVERRPEARGLWG